MSTAIAGVGVEGIAVRLAAVRQMIGSAAERAGRRPQDVTLIAVSKTFGVADIEAAIAAGVTDLGENRVQEAQDKLPMVSGTARWHLIGHLQRNKINKALELFDLIHGTDSLDLATAIGHRADRRGLPARTLLQVSVDGNVSQFGFEPDALRRSAKEIAVVPGLRLEGLMCIAPHVDDPEEARPAFQLLAGLAREMEETMRGSGHPWSHLSMGMSNDYPVAIEEGATLVRVGRAIFGERG